MGNCIVFINGKRFDVEVVDHMASSAPPYTDLPQIEQIDFNGKLSNIDEYIIHEVTTADGRKEVFAAASEGRPEEEIMKTLQALARNYGCTTNFVVKCASIFEVLAWAEANNRKIGLDAPVNANRTGN